MNTLARIGIVSLGAYAPPNVLTNFDMEKIVDTSDEWIRTRSGISQRHIADAATATSDVAYGAALPALERAGLSPEEIDLIIVATVSPDMPLPSTACFLQHRLGAVNAAAFDISAACTGFIYSCNIGQAMVASGQYRNALVVGADTLSKFTDYTDRRICVLLGDGAGAAVLKPVPEDRGFRSFYLRADGSLTDLLKTPAGGSRNPASFETVQNRQHFITMNGPEVFKFAVRIMEEAVVNALDQAGLTLDDVTYIVPHQANIRIIESAMKRLPIPAERWVVNIQNYGNTSAASIPLALNEVYERGGLHEGDVIVMVGFGGGLTWGATVVRW